MFFLATLTPKTVIALLRGRDPGFLVSSIPPEFPKGVTKPTKSYAYTQVFLLLSHIVLYVLYRSVSVHMSYSL